MNFKQYVTESTKINEAFSNNQPVSFMAKAWHKHPEKFYGTIFKVSGNKVSVAIMVHDNVTRSFKDSGLEVVLDATDKDTKLTTVSYQEMEKYLDSKRFDLEATAKKTFG